MRSCFIHLGTHKTGTTSLQAALDGSRAALGARGYLYPCTGRPPVVPYGHHNLAWEITGDHRFDAAHGTINDLVDEISSMASHVILSSEDFECSIHHHERFSDVIARLRRCGFDVKLILYLRNQSDYSQSLYLTMLRFGIVQSFGEFVDDILDDGLFRWQEWVFQFSYADLLAQLREFRDVEVIVRSYDAPNGGSLIGDFLSILDLTAADLGIDEHLRINVRPDVPSALAQFYANRKRAPPDPVELEFIASTFNHLKGRAIDISSDTRRRIAQRFGHSSPRVRMACDGPGQDIAGPFVEVIFSAETCQRIADQSKTRREGLDRPEEREP